MVNSFGRYLLFVNQTEKDPNLSPSGYYWIRTEFYKKNILFNSNLIKLLNVHIETRNMMMTFLSAITSIQSGWTDVELSRGRHDSADGRLFFRFFFLKLMGYVGVLSLCLSVKCSYLSIE